MNNKNVIVVEDYDSLQFNLKNIEGNILNTTGSRNIDKIISFNLNNRSNT